MTKHCLGHIYHSLRFRKWRITKARNDTKVINSLALTSTRRSNIINRRDVQAISANAGLSDIFMLTVYRILITADRIVCNVERSEIGRRTYRTSVV